jgi:hypothetical protein
MCTARFRTNSDNNNDDDDDNNDSDHNANDTDKHNNIVAAILYLETFGHWQIRTFTAEGLEKVITAVSFVEGEWNCWQASIMLCAAFCVCWLFWSVATEMTVILRALCPVCPLYGILLGMVEREMTLKC